MNKLLTILSTGAIIVMMASCCCTGNSQQQIKELQDKDSGSTVNASVGDTIKVVLDANATTGYTWDILDYNTDVIKLDKSDYQVDSDLMGAPGKQIYFFSVVGNGKAELKIIYHRPWEKEKKPIQTFDLTIAAE